MVYWITGYSGAGKTTIGTLLYNYLKKNQKNLVLLDGDKLREVFGNDLGYTKEDRYRSAMRNVQLCKMLSEQGIDVICCTISMFEDIRKYNRDNIKDYVEIYVKVDIDTLYKRDQKKMYSNNEKNLVGVDIFLDEPKNPDIILYNDNISITEQFEILKTKLKKLKKEDIQY